MTSLRVPNAQFAVTDQKYRFQSSHYPLITQPPYPESTDQFCDQVHSNQTWELSPKTAPTLKG